MTDRSNSRSNYLRRRRAREINQETTMPREYPNRPPSETNPRNEPTGHFTGRCMKCGSDDLWDDNLHYGCNNCGATYLADSNPQPRLIPNGEL